MKSFHLEACQRVVLAAASAAALLAAAGPAGAAEAVSDAQAQAVAQKILDDYKQEREQNIPRWGTLAFDEGASPPADCPRAKGAGAAPASGKPPVSFKDCNLEYFKLREQRFTQILQSWAVLTPAQKAEVGQQLDPLFAGLAADKSTSLAGQTVAKGYLGGGAAAGVLQALGITIDDGSAKLRETLLQGSFAKGSGILDDVLAAHSRADIGDLRTQSDAANARFKGTTSTALVDRLKLTKFDTDVQKNRLTETANIAGNSRARVDAVQAITRKIQALGSSGKDASLVSQQLAEYEFQLAALDALGREELIKAAAQRQGDRAQVQLVNAAAEARSWSKAIERASK